MIIFDKKVKDLEIPKGLGNISVDIASGNTDSISEVKVQDMIDDSQAKQDTDWERTIRQERAATDNAIAAAAAEALHDAEDYTDSGVSYAIETANAYTDSAITLTEYDYVLRSAANAGDVNAFLQWASQFDENDLKKIRVFYKMRVLRFENANLSQGWMSLQGVDATYMHNNRIYVSRLGFTADQAPSWDERAFDLNTFVNSAQTEEIIESAEEKFNVVTHAYMQIWDTNIESVNLVFYRVRALIEEAGGWNMYSQSEVGRMHVYFRHDGLLRDFRIAKAEENEITLYWVGTTDDWHHLFDNGVLMMATVVIRWNTQITANDYKEYTFNPVS